MSLGKKDFGDRVIFVDGSMQVGGSADFMGTVTTICTEVIGNPSNNNTSGDGVPEEHLITQVVISDEQQREILAKLGAANFTREVTITLLPSIEDMEIHNDVTLGRYICHKMGDIFNDDIRSRFATLGNYGLLCKDISKKIEESIPGSSNNFFTAFAEILENSRVKEYLKNI